MSERILRFHVPELSDGQVVLDGSEAHHAAHVLRLKPGADVELFDGRGGRAAGRVADVGRSEVAVDVVDLLPPAEPAGPAAHLAFAVPKGKRLDWLLEKATELAAASLQPVLFERSVAGPDELTDAKRSRWLTHCIAAAKQCGLAHLPELRGPIALGDLLAADRATTLLADAEGPPPAEAFEAMPNALLVIVGPEGGLTDAERADCLAARCLPVCLAPTILRTETAALAALAAIRAMGKPRSAARRG